MDSSQHFTCEICEKNFSTNKNKDQHTRIVHGETNYRCDHCLKFFYQLGNVNNHIKTVHEGERNYKCDSCGKYFTRSHHLKTHIKTIHE